MNTTELIALLKSNEFGGGTGKPREISFQFGDTIIGTPDISVSGSGDGLVAELYLRLEADEDLIITGDGSVEGASYPTRMHEVLGVETGEVFEIPIYSNNRYFVDTNGNILGIAKDAEYYADGLAVSYAINHGITRRPRPTEEQVRMLKALVMIGLLWIVKMDNGNVYACSTEPRKDKVEWLWSGISYRLYADEPPGCLRDLVHWSDPAPLDIVQTLRDAGRLEGEWWNT